jgi:ribonuclease Z
MADSKSRLRTGLTLTVVLLVGMAAGAFLLDPVRNTVVTKVAAHKVHEQGLDRGPPAGVPGDFETDPKILAQVMTAGQPLGRWKDGLTFKGVEPMPWLKNAVNWFPKTETVQPDEMRVTFMGTTPLIRPGQMGTSIFVELGNGKDFVFDLGEGSAANYIAAGVPLNRINDIFLTHLHWDHVGSVPYVYAFGGWGGRWHDTFRVTGPSGDRPELGTRYLMDRMKEMLTWHRDSFDTLPIGKGWEMEVNQFDYRDDGGVIYNKDGVKITHWQQSHAENGASAYRLDWNGMCLAYTGDGRPNSLTIKYAKGCDLLITEIQPDVVSAQAKAFGVMPSNSRLLIDAGHNPAYAAGYLYEQVQPRLAMGTHVNYDTFSEAELYAQVREHFKGPFRLGAPDMIVVNMTRDKVWVRDGVVPKYPSISPPQFDVRPGDGLVIPPPRHHSRADIQSKAIRDAEINPDLYYPRGYHPQMLQAWPSTKPIYLPEKMVPPAMKGGPVPAR